MRFFLLSIYFFVCITTSYSQELGWKQIGDKQFILNTENAFRYLKTNPNEITLPNDTNGYDTFIIKRTNVIDKSVAKYYTIQTFHGYKKGNKQARLSLSISPTYFSSTILQPTGGYSLEQLPNKNEIVVKRNLENKTKIKCGVTDDLSFPLGRLQQLDNTNEMINIDGERIYRLAISASGEYAQQFGGNPYNATNVLNAIASGVNDVNLIYTRDLGARFVLVSDDRTVYEDETTDPFDPSDQIAMIDENGTLLNDTYGAANYDVGHLIMWANTGGVAYVGVICNDNYKGKGFSGANFSTKILWIDYVCHELGHQFGSKHNFVSTECGTSADDYRFEVGEGSSIMSYAGVCGSGYVNESDPYFHYTSINQILSTMQSNDCTPVSSTTNTVAPTADAKADITIPKQTAFILVGEITDSDTGITYQWEQNDGKSVAVSGSPDCTSADAPLFRFRPPVTERFRCFPQHSEVLANNQNNIEWEKLPCAARTMNFSLLGRDNNADYGRIGADEMTVTVANTGPFEVTYPNGGETITEEPNITITWNVAGTDSHCSNVDILLTTDNGETYTEIKDNTANDGSEQVSLPNIDSSTARILVRCHVNTSTPYNARYEGDEFRIESTFYDVSDATFTLENSLLVPVEFGTFTGEHINNLTNYLYWNTFSENNNELFNIQRKTTTNWQTIGVIDGAGTTNKQQEYSYFDYNAAVGSNFYRLQQVDFDGTSEFSSIIEVITPEQKISTNYIANKFFITGAISRTQVEIYDLQGVRHYSIQIENDHIINCSNLAKGVYIVQIKNREETLTKKIRIE